MLLAVDHSYKALYRTRVQPLENNSNTVLVFGGVQWLATQHIHMLLKTLTKYAFFAQNILSFSLIAFRNGFVIHLI